MPTTIKPVFLTMSETFERPEAKKTAKSFKKTLDIGKIRWKIFIHQTISATLPSTYQNVLKLVEI